MSRHSALFSAAITLLVFAQSAQAGGGRDSVRTYVACGRTREAKPSSRCSHQARVGAFFKSSPRDDVSSLRAIFAWLSVIARGVRRPKRASSTSTMSSLQSGEVHGHMVIQQESSSCEFRSGRPCRWRSAAPSVFQIIGAASGLVVIIATLAWDCYDKEVRASK